MKNRIILVSLISAVFITGLSFADECKMKSPNVSGQFYPSDKNELSDEIDNFYGNVNLDSSIQDKDILVVISPHAGYEYSGQVAAYGFKAVKDRNFDSVIVIAPAHFNSFYSAAVYKEGYFQTPLGDIPVDSELAGKLIASSRKFSSSPEVFEREHAAEVELPFLQKSIPNLKIVPVIVGQIDYVDCLDIARAIAKATENKRVLLVISTDLSHYHPYLDAVKLDSSTISYMKDVDPLGLWQAYTRQEVELCGLLPVFIGLNYAKELGLKAEVLKTANSGDVSGDKSKVVGYASVILYKGKDFDESKSKIEGDGQMFNEKQKRRLLEIARQTITKYVTKGEKPSFDDTDPQLNIQRGAFVTLHESGSLRGCIGQFTSDEPIYKVISDMAVESATSDPRFPAVTKDELNKIDIEISVLTQPEPISDWKKIRLGVDGVIVKRGFSQGVFLPQVATETGWDLETFLGELCSQKARLSRDAYKDPKTQIYTFQAVIFSEKE